MNNRFACLKYAALALLLAAVLAAALFAAANRTKQIYLYGEVHSAEIMLEKEFQLWDSYYHKAGMRDLFIEMPYYTAEFLNLWMQSDNDDILNQLFKDLEGTAAYFEATEKFYRKIKESCPETVFHGTDVGHQYASTGKRFLEYLQSEGLEGSESYALAQQAIEQGRYYYEYSDDLYRENTMTENFIREFDSLGGASVMGIYGSAHTGLEALDHTNSIPCMANQLKEHYGAIVHAENLRSLVLDMPPVKTGKISVNHKEYDAISFGKINTSSFSSEYLYREFWRLEHAYDDFKHSPCTGDVLPYSNYPMAVEEGQVFVIEYTKADHSTVRKYYRSDGNTWENALITQEFAIEE